MHLYFSWQNLSVGAQICQLMTLTFDLLLKKINLGFNFLINRDRAFILKVCIPYGKTFLLVPNFTLQQDLGLDF